jgi:hypothetical protein
MHRYITGLEDRLERMEALLKRVGTLYIYPLPLGVWCDSCRESAPSAARPSNSVAFLFEEFGWTDYIFHFYVVYSTVPLRLMIACSSALRLTSRKSLVHQWFVTLGKTMQIPNAVFPLMKSHCHQPLVGLLPSHHAVYPLLVLLAQSCRHRKLVLGAGVPQGPPALRPMYRRMHAHPRRVRKLEN